MVLIALHIVLTMAFSCGIVNKQKSNSSNSRNMELLNSESSSEKSDLQISEWQKNWMQHLGYSTALIFSDSTITYHPDGGFQISRGSLLFTQLNQKETANEEGTLQKLSNISETQQLQQEKEDEQNKAISSNKERRIPSPLIWIPIGVLIIILLYRRIKRVFKMD